MFASLLLLPSWIKVAIGAVLVVGVLQVAHWWQVRGLRDTIEDLTQALDKERVATAELKVGISDLMKNRDELADTIAKQSASIAAIERRSQQAQQRARADALSAIRAAERRAEELRLPASLIAPGHAEMNAWLSERFKE